MRMRVGLVALTVVTCVARASWAQECELFNECLAGMCQGGQCVGVPLNSGPCNDFNACTPNDSCVAGECVGGTPTVGPSCDDGNECTTNDACADFFGAVVCMGTPVEAGTRCASNCGTCQETVPGVPQAGMICRSDPERVNQPCTPGDEFDICFDGRCMAQGVPPIQFASCFPRLRECPDTDGDPCTGHFCNFETNACDVSEFPLRQDCFPAECHRCVPETGQCVPNNVGRSCDDFNECTASSVCSSEGGCVAGSPQQTATPTRTTAGNTPTPTASAGPGTPTNTAPANTATPSNTPGTPTATPTQGRCVGDCNNNGVVVVNEMVIGVNIALDRANIDSCPQFDTNASNSVQVNELVLGVNSLLRGCVAAAAAR